MRQMDKLESALTKCLRTRMGKAHMRWSDFSRQSTEIVVFGSRAIGMGRQSSDLDVFVVGDGTKRIKGFGIDLISVRAAELGLQSWLRSELAGHVLQYGVWLKGSGAWRERVFVGPEAVRQKERRLTSLVRSVKHSWERLHPAFQLKYRVSIRRELQRLLLLQAAIPIPPTPVLDLEWRDRGLGQGPFTSISTAMFDEVGEFSLKDLLA